MTNLTKFILLCVLFVPAMTAQSSRIIVNGSGVERITAASGNEFDSGLTAVTTGAGVDLATTTVKVQLIFCTNTTATARTIDILDGAVSPNTYWNDVELAANSVVLVANTVIGLPMDGGVTITASANSAISCQVVGVN